MKRLTAIFLICFLLAGCASSEPVSTTVFAMDTVMTFHLWGDDAEEVSSQYAQMFQQISNRWSTQVDGSIPCALNAGEDPGLTAEEEAVLERIQALYVRTGGAFNPYLRNVMEVWGFYDQEYLNEDYELPTAEQIAAALADPAYDFGGVIKGYAGAYAAEQLLGYDVDRATLSLGGNIQTFGTKADGSPWLIGIQDPNGGDSLGILSVEGTCAVVTSGDYQRYFEYDGVKYHHIIDPETGYPADSGLCSVTIICADGLTADALSTALFVMGLEEGAEFWRSSDDFEAVFVTTDGAIYATEGAVLSGCEYEVITR